MPAKILSTKLFIPPPRKDLVSRPRLLDALRQGSTRKLTLISAPAGYGKTTLLSEWIDQQEMPFGWLSLDQGDNDLDRFLAYLIACLLSIPIEDIGERSFQVDNEPEPVSSTCVVFAKAEATGKLHEGWSANEVIAAYCIAMARRITELINRLGVEREFAITGGQSKNIGVVRRIENEIGVEALPWKDMDPQIAGALGAALFAKALMEKSRKRKS